MKSLGKFFPLALIIFFSVLSRLINLEELFYFTYDEEIPAFVGRRIIQFHHIPLIGGATPFGFHLGPYFYWFYAFLLSLTKLNPIAWGWAGAFISGLTTFLIFKVGTEFGGKKVAVTAAVFWAFSYLVNVYDRHMWALYWGPIISLLVLFFLNRIILGNNKYIIPLGFVLALAIHADPSNLIFIGLAAITWVVFKLPLNKQLVFSLLLIPILIFPLIYFDLRHDFANIKPVSNFLRQGKNTPGFNSQKFIDNTVLFTGSLNRLVYQFGDSEVSKQYSYCQNYVSEKYQAIPPYLNLVALTFLISFVYVSFKKSNKFGWRLISILLFLYFLGIQLYGTVLKGDIFEHYITGIFPSFFLILAFFVVKLPKKIWLFLLAVFIFANLFKLSTAKNGMGLLEKKKAIQYTMSKVGDSPFSLDSLSTCWKWNGYRYLFIPFGREPVKSYVDPNFAYLYETTPVAQNHPNTVVAFVVHDFAPETTQYYRRYALLKGHEKSSSIFGNIEVIIMDNSNHWFDQTN